MILARTQNEMKRAAYCAVQMIQNVSKNRTNKKITLNDIKNITRAWMIMVPSTQKALEIGKINMVTNLILLEGTGNDMCKIKWIFCVLLRKDTNQIGFISVKLLSGFCQWGCCSVSKIYKQIPAINQSVTSTSIYPDLHITSGEIKVILELTFEDYTKTNLKSAQKMLGLRILKGPTKYLQNTNNFTYFDTHVIFTPINGIFNVGEPPK